MDGSLLVRAGGGYVTFPEFFEQYHLAESNQVQELYSNNKEDRDQLIDEEDQYSSK